MKAIVYINQFFGQIGGEELADFEPEIREGAVGSALALNAALGSDVEVTHTIICGDNFMGSNTEEAISRIMEMLKDKKFDIFFAGPAFRAGRYGAACGHICRAVQKGFNVPVISSMNEENPGVEMFRKEMYIFKGGASAAAMRKDAKAMASFGLKLLKNEKLLPAKEEGYFGRGIREQIWLDPPVPATERVIDMLLKKINKEPFESELVIPKSDRVAIAPAISPDELSKMEIALVTSGGIVPVGNPDRIQSASATKWGKYDISKLNDLVKGEYMTIHAGFDPAAANDDSDVIVPLDALRKYQEEKKIGGVFKYFYSTVGTGTTQAEATRMGKEIAKDLLDHGIRAAILTSTWGTCTRCGATMTREIERAGITIVQMANLIPVAKTVGVNRLVPTISIPYPLGDPATPKEEQFKLRYHRVGVALDALTEDIKEPKLFKVKI